jgi:hypothetical protein
VVTIKELKWDYFHSISLSQQQQQHRRKLFPSLSLCPNSISNQDLVHTFCYKELLKFQPLPTIPVSIRVRKGEQMEENERERVE